MKVTYAAAVAAEGIEWVWWDDDDKPNEPWIVQVDADTGAAVTSYWWADHADVVHALCLAAGVES